METRFGLRSINIYYCGKERCTGGHFFGPATRPHHLIHFVLKGKGRYYARGKVFHLKQGDAFLIYPNESTYYIADEKTPWDYAWVALGGTEIDTLFELCSMEEENLILKWKDPTVSETEGNLRAEKILNLVDLFLGNHFNELELLGAFYSVFSYMAKKEANEILTSKKLYFKEACAYIWHNYGYDIRISDIAGFIGIDRTYLYKIFREEKQMSPQQYLISVRLQKAVNMLYNQKMTITEVAVSCGFKDGASFSRHFKEAMGRSPREFKKEIIPFE